MHLNFGDRLINYYQTEYLNHNISKQYKLIHLLTIQYVQIIKGIFKIRNLQHSSNANSRTFTFASDLVNPAGSNLCHHRRLESSNSEWGGFGPPIAKKQPWPANKCLQTVADAFNNGRNRRFAVGWDCKQCPLYDQINQFVFIGSFANAAVPIWTNF